MADTGFKFPGTVVRDRGAGDHSWVNPDNVKLDNSLQARATAITANDVSRGLACTNFDFSLIPPNAVIDGIEIRIGDYDHNDTGAVVWFQITLILADDSDGSESKDGEPNDFASSLQTDEAGGASDLWSETITTADVQNSNWGVMLRIIADTELGAGRIDFLQMKVHFHTLAPKYNRRHVGFYGV